MTGGQRVQAIVVGVLAIAAIVYAALGTLWLDGPGDLGFGLRDFVACHAAGCDRQAISELPALGLQSGFAESGWATTVAAGVSCLTLLFALIPIALGDASSFTRAMARLAQLSLFLALIAGTVFVLRRPANNTFGLGRDFIIFGVGIILGFTAAMTIARARPRHQDA